MIDHQLRAVLEFDHRGKLHAILLDCEDDEDEKTLRGAIERLIKPGFWDRIGWLFSFRN
jgi:hypothetical protein